jgi:hypothetical protein
MTNTILINMGWEQYIPSVFNQILADLDQKLNETFITKRKRIFDVLVFDIYCNLNSRNNFGFTYQSQEEGIEVNYSVQIHCSRTNIEVTLFFKDTQSSIQVDTIGYDTIVTRFDEACARLQKEFVIEITKLESYKREVVMV